MVISRQKIADNKTDEKEAKQETSFVAMAVSFRVRINNVYVCLKEDQSDGCCNKA